MTVRDPWFADLSDDEAWMLYNLVTARTEALDAAEIEAMSNLGGQPWRDLRRKLKELLIQRTVHPQAATSQPGPTE